MADRLRIMINKFVNLTMIELFNLILVITRFFFFFFVLACKENKVAFGHLVHLAQARESSFIVFSKVIVKS